ncbi:MAG: PPE family protein, SVP subgroup, partial [Mycobacterium sp.]
GNNFVQAAKTLGLIGAPAAAAAGGAANVGAPGLGALGAMLGGGGGGGGSVSAGLGGASSVGGLSVPPSWGGAGATLPPATSSPLPISSISAAPETGAGAGNLLGGMPLAGAGAGAPGTGPRYGFRPTVMARPPFAG